MKLFCHSGLFELPSQLVGLSQKLRNIFSSRFIRCLRPEAKQVRKDTLRVCARIARLEVFIASKRRTSGQRRRLRRKSPWWVFRFGFLLGLGLIILSRRVFSLDVAVWDGGLLSQLTVGAIPDG
jgi:hypothetical protein